MSCSVQQGEYVSGNVFLRTFSLPKAGQSIGDHTHQFDHTTFVETGAVQVRKISPEGVTRTFVVYSKEYRAVRGLDRQQPSSFLVEAKSRHLITALVDDTEVVCIYAHRDPQGGVVQAFTGWQPAYA